MYNIIFSLSPVAVVKPFYVGWAVQGMNRRMKNPMILVSESAMQALEALIDGNL